MLAIVFGAVVLVLLTSPAFAQEDVEQLEELKAERERIQAEQAAQALLLDASQADFDDVAAALDAINGLVDLQESRLADAEQAVASAEALVTQAELREAEILLELTELRSNVGDLAIASFTGEAGANGQDLTALLLSNDPSQAARRRSLVEFQTGSLADSIDRIRALQAEASLVSERRRAAADAAQAGRIEAERRRGELADAQAAQLEIVQAAEARLEHRLAEAAFLEERDAEAAAEIRKQEEAIARRIRAEAARKAAEEAARRAAEQAATRPPVADADDIVSVRGIQVHESIASTVDQMIGDALSDGVTLGGWGYRSNVKQIELRQAHCGTSDYAVWDMPASACRPPTARPGQSMHERGLAIDFTYNGGSITTRSNPGFVWLSENASRYGFVNLPSEPWHWSTNGN